MNAPGPQDPLHESQERLKAEIAKREAAEAMLARVQTAYTRFVPPQLLSMLGKESILDVAWGNQVEAKMTILFSDIRGFASISERMAPQQSFDFINAYLSFMEPVVVAEGGFIDKYIGDSVMALFPVRGDDALRAALGMLKELQHFNAEWNTLLSDLPNERAEKQAATDVHIGIGLNSGLLMLGVVGGFNRMEITVISDAVNLASRIESLTKVYQTPILISQHTLNSIRHPGDFAIRFVDRVKVRGKHLAQSIYEVFNADPPHILEGKKATQDLFEDALAHYHFNRIGAASSLFASCLEINPGDTPAMVYWRRCSGDLPPTSDHDGVTETDLEAVWRPEYLLGMPFIDEAHINIFSSILHLAGALLEEAEDRAVALIDTVITQTEDHFLEEERVMGANAYTYSAHMEHSQQHRKFRDFLGTLEADIRGGRISSLRMAFRCQFLLLDWFISHISITDRHLTRFLANTASGELKP
jgi:hemerythrin-like metal-binding protein